MGAAGFSLGGIHAWLAGAADPRVAAVAAVSGVQGFGWAVANNMYHVSLSSGEHGAADWSCRQLSDRMAGFKVPSNQLQVHMKSTKP